MRSLISCFLYKSFTAARAGNVNLALALRYTEVILAGGTLEEAEGLTLAQLVYLPEEVIANLMPLTHGSRIFRSALLDIAGKDTEYGK